MPTIVGRRAGAGKWPEAPRAPLACSGTRRENGGTVASTPAMTRPPSPRTGCDLQRVDVVSDAIRDFGARYLDRVYTPGRAGVVRHRRRGLARGPLRGQGGGPQADRHRRRRRPPQRRDHHRRRPPRGAAQRPRRRAGRAGRHRRRRTSTSASATPATWPWRSPSAHSPNTKEAAPHDREPSRSAPSSGSTPSSPPTSPRWATATTSTRAGMTSHASVTVMLACEDEWDIEFPQHMLKKSTFASVDAIAAALDELDDHRRQRRGGVMKLADDHEDAARGRRAGPPDRPGDRGHPRRRRGRPTRGSPRRPSTRSAPRACWAR